MSKFEDNLWAHLERDHAPTMLKTLATRRRTRTRRWVGAAAGVVVIGVAALIGPAYFGGTPPAYAIVDNPDGSVTLTVWEIAKFGEATEKLSERGIPAAAAAMRLDCPDEERTKYEWPSGDQLPVVPDKTAGEFTLVIDAKRIPAGATLVLGARPAGGSWVASAVYARGALPNCLPG